MAGDADYATDLAQTAADDAIARIRRAASAMPAGAPGECLGCEEESPRLVGGYCARCRDRLTARERLLGAVRDDDDFEDDEDER